MQIGVYILKCGNGRYYTGSSNKVDRRLTEHQSGQVKATKNILPVKLAFFQPCDTLLEARRLELEIKRYKSRLIIERIITDREIKFLKQVERSDGHRTSQ